MSKWLALGGGIGAAGLAIADYLREGHTTLFSLAFGLMAVVDLLRARHEFWGKENAKGTP